MPKLQSLILGASSSIGDEVIRAMLDKTDCELIASYHNTDIDKGLKGKRVTTAQLNLCDQNSQRGFLRSLSNKDIKLQTLILLPGIIFGQPLHGYSDDDIDKVMDVNFTSQAKFIRDIKPYMAPQSRLILIGSIASERGSFDPFYAASKGALIPFAKSLARAYGNDFSTITLLPGPIKNSKMYDEMSPQTQKRHREQNPTGDILSAKDLAHIIVDLSQPHWQQANGSIIRINGGAYV